MEEPISKSAAERLPSAIKSLNGKCQKIYICLRLRKSDNEIARQLHLSLEETCEGIDTVRNELIKAGQLDLIENPRFISIQADDPDSQDIPVAGADLDIDKKLIIKEFLSCLKEAVDELPEHQSRLLKLRYKYQLSAKDIMGFSKKMGFCPIPDKEVSELREQDIFYGLNVALKDVFKGLKNRHSDLSSFGMDNLKYIFEEIGI